MRWLMLIVGLALLLLSARGSFISSSSLSNCVLDGSSSIEEASLSCDQKMVVAVTVTNGQEGTETIEATVETAQDADGEVKRLKYPLSITMTKSEAFIIYPIDYRQSVNAAPIEETIYTSLFGCDDGDVSSSPTCGWYLKNDGNVVPHSQGFCCSCSLSQVLGASDDTSRAGLSCSLFGDASSAHCLRFGELWYDAFEIGTSFISYDITVTMSSYIEDGLGGGSTHVETVTLGPEQPIGVSADGNLIGKLIGDFAPFEQFTVLSEKYLMAPSRPAGNPRVTAGMADWMLLDKTDVELDGLSCNKVGVSFEAFRTEYAACDNQPGSCLRNQLEDFYQEDKVKRDRGQVGDYFLENFGSFNLLQSSDDSTANDLVLGQQVDQIQNSLVTLMFPADDIRFVTNRSPGKISQAYVAEFEALSKNGEMHVQITNTGTLQADFTVTVTECSVGVQEVPAKVSSIAPGAREEHLFDIRSQNGLQLDYQCTGHLEDARVVLFSTTEQETDDGAQGYDEDPSEGGEILQGDLPFKALECSDLCTSYFDLLCFAVSGCWTRLIQIAVVAIIVLVLAVTKKTTSLQSSFLDNRTSSMKKAEQARSDKRKRKEYARQVREEIAAYAKASASVHAQPLPTPPPVLPPRDYQSHLP